MGPEAQGRGAGPCWQEDWALEATDLPLTKCPDLPLASGGAWSLHVPMCEMGTFFHTRVYEPVSREA